MSKEKSSATKILSLTLAQMVNSARVDAGLSQKQLARKMKTKQESISRSEKKGFSVKLAEKALNSMGKKLAFHHVSFGTPSSYSTYFLGGMNNFES